MHPFERSQVAIYLLCTVGMSMSCQSVRAQNGDIEQQNTNLLALGDAIQKFRRPRVLLVVTASLARSLLLHPDSQSLNEVLKAEKLIEDGPRIEMVDWMSLCRPMSPAEYAIIMMNLGGAGEN